MKTLVTGASGNAGQAVCALLVEQGCDIRRADVSPAAHDRIPQVEFVRCDTRTPDDVRFAVEGCDAVIHLAAWHCAHVPPVSDSTIYAVNVDGTFNVMQACREHDVKAFVYASSMAYSWGAVYGLTKVLGEEICRSFHEIIGASVAILRYHAFVPGPYLEFGTRLLRNGVDRQDVARGTVAALHAARDRRFGLFNTIIHTDHHMPREVIEDFRGLGPEWCEDQVPGAKALIAKYGLELPQSVEHHDLSEAERLTGWTPKVGFADFLRDLQQRDAAGEDVRALFVPGELPTQ